MVSFRRSPSKRAAPNELVCELTDSPAEDRIQIHIRQARQHRSLHDPHLNDFPCFSKNPACNLTSVRALKPPPFAEQAIA
jgi:hypothetical protein